MQGRREGDCLLIFSATVGLIVLSLFHLLALFLYLYWFYWWLDTVMHILGGFFVGILILGLCRGYGMFKRISIDRFFFYFLFPVLFMAVIWELFEIYIGYVDPSIGAAYWLGTFTDVTATLLGGSIAFTTLFYTRCLFRK